MYICIIFIFRSLFCAFSFFFLSLSLSRSGFYLLPFFRCLSVCTILLFFIWCSIFFLCCSLRFAAFIYFFLFSYVFANCFRLKYSRFILLLSLYTYGLCDERARGRTIQISFFSFHLLCFVSVFFLYFILTSTNANAICCVFLFTCCRCYLAFC